MAMVVQGLLYSWKKNQDYANRLVADLTEEQMIGQPSLANEVIMNHPAWVFSHLNVYLPIIAAIIENKSFDDPKPHPFGMQSKPEKSRAVYATKEQLIQIFNDGHDRVTKLLGDATDAVLANAVALPRWRELMPTAAVALPYLMLLHENQHLGQVSAWRRCLGLPSV